MRASTYNIGDFVYWEVGNTRCSGKVIDIISHKVLAEVTNELQATEHRGNVLLVQLDDGRKVLKRSLEVNLEKRGFV